MSDDYRVRTIEGTALPLPGDDIDTDRIIPARYLRAISFDGLEKYVFEDDRSAALTASRSAALTASRAAAAHPFDDPRFGGARVLVVHRNFGCGSSREHAPQALYRWGIRAIVGESFSDIFFGNSLMMGLPCVTAARGDLDALMALVSAEPKTAVRVSLETLECVAGDLTCAIAIPPNAREALVSGAWDTTGMLLDRFDDVRQVASRLPYIGGFRTPPAA